MTESIHSNDAPIRIGISSCLLGAKVRYDSGHKQDHYISGTLGQYFEFVPVCPEMEIGLGAPRPTIRLVQNPDDPEGSPKVVGTKVEGIDVTEDLHDLGRRRAAELTDLCGYIFKRASPSCGMERVKVYSAKGHPVSSASGAFAEEFMKAHPLLPYEEEGRLGDPRLRENFIQRVFVYHRWRKLLAEGLTAGKLVDFHTRHKMMILAHDEPTYRDMGRLVAEAGSKALDDIRDQYVEMLMSALKKAATHKSHTNVLGHLVGYLKRDLDAVDKAELLETIDDYRLGKIPLVVPLVLLRHHFRRHPNDYIGEQYYLEPHPKELHLRNLL